MKYLAVISLIFVLYSCGTLPETGQDFRYSGKSYEKVFQAVLESVPDINFSIVSNDINSGVIVAEKFVSDNENGEIRHRLDVAVETTARGVKVEITSDKQPSIDEDEDYLKKFVKVLKRRAPVYLNVVSH